MKLNLPKKCGEMYVAFDENNNPLYGFRVRGYKECIIEEFVRLSDELPEFIVLPKLNKNAFVPEEADEFDLSKLGVFRGEDYVKGNIKLCNRCFKGIKNAKIVLPYNTSVMLDWGCFDDGAEIEFVVPENIGLKQVYRTFDTGFDYEHEYWTILCDKRIVCEIGGYGDSYCTSEYTIDYNPFNKFKISEDYQVDIDTQEIVEISHTVD